MSVGLDADFPSDGVFITLFPIHRACRDGDLAALVSLLQRLSNQAHLTVEDSCNGWTPLHWAAQYGQLECVVHLVQTGCEVNLLTSRFNQTPIHIAASGGHSHCVVWLIQAGADVNRQDLVGEAPIHKAARSGRLECIEIMLRAGAKPHLRNASGQTAADLADTHGFQDCSHLISKSQLSGLHMNKIQNANSAPWYQDLLSRKRQLSVVYNDHMKKARRSDDALVQLQSSESEVCQSMDMESAQELNTANRQTAAAAQHSSADMCGSLHLTGSPSSCVSHWPTWWGLVGADCLDILHYSHFHGFGDTAEELSDIRCLKYSSRVQAEHSTNHLYHGS